MFLKKNKNRVLNYFYSKLKSKILSDINLLQNIDKQVKKIHIDNISKYLVLGEESKLYEEANVFNLRNDKEKISIGKSTHIKGELLLFGHGGEIAIGNNCFIGQGTRIWSAEHVEIGNNVLISHNCNIIDTDSHELDYIKRASTFQNMIKYGHANVNNDLISKHIIIEDYAWLSFNVTVLKGVKIGKGAIVAAGSIVTKDVEPFTVVAGNPARYVKSINNNL
jgi:acetyltransferase-like isoleucine patch superfamily enzyme